VDGAMQHPLRSDSAKRTEDSGLPSALCSELWALIIERLNSGEVLIADQQFQAAFEEDYRQLTGAAITPSIRRQLSRMIAQVNRHHPETYVAKGVQNGVSRAFGEGVRTLNWNTAKVEEKGMRSIQRFAKQDNVRDLLEEINVPLGDIDALDCIQSAVEELAKAQPATPAPLLIPSLAEFEALSQSAPEPLQAKAEPEPALVDPDVQLAIEAGEIDEKEVARRTQQADQRQAELEAEEMAKVPQNLAAYVADGRITEEEAGKIKALREVDERLEEGEIDEEEASNIRNSILSGQARDELDKKIKEAVDHSVRYVQVFESMQKIPLDYDAPLQFLIRHKQAVLSEQSGTPALAEAIKGLMEDAPILGRVIDVR
jgi:hypothetical protein